MNRKKGTKRSTLVDSAAGKRGTARAKYENEGKAQLNCCAETSAKVGAVRPSVVDASHRFGKRSGNK